MAKEVNFINVIERALIFLLFFSFAMPYLRIGLDGLVWPREYAETPGGLPRLMEVLVLVLLLFQLAFKRIDITSVSKMGRVFLLGLILLVYTSLFYPLLVNTIVPFHAPTIEGGIRANIFIPLVAYVVGFHLSLTNNKTANLIIVSLVSAGLLQTIAMLSPDWFPDYMIHGNLGGSEMWSSSGEYLGILQRQAGFYSRSTDAAAFTVLLIGFLFALLPCIRSGIKRVTLFASLLVFVMALLSTLQRIPFVAFVAVVFFVVVVEKREFGLTNKSITGILHWLGIAGVIIVGIVQLPYLLMTRLSIQSVSEFGLDYRFEAIWPAYISFVLREPFVLIFGAGYGAEALDRMGNPMHMAHAHNQYLSWLSGIGLPMTIVFVLLFFTLYKYGRKCMTSSLLSPSEKTWGRFMVTSLLAIMIISLGESPLLAEPISILLFLTGGMTTSVFCSLRRKEQYSHADELS